LAQNDKTLAQNDNSGSSFCAYICTQKVFINLLFHSFFIILSSDFTIKRRMASRLTEQYIRQIALDELLLRRLIKEEQEQQESDEMINEK